MKHLFYNIFFWGLLFANIFSVQAQTHTSDAIAVRVIPNPGHLSAMEWYRAEGFSGSPQSTIVDGYEAVRDGRTVYVNVANVQDFGGVDTIFTNIYLISYNQQARKATIDIFGKILANWKFNTNLNAIGQCRKNSDNRCFTDAECDYGDVCDSAKGRVTRDTRRLSDLSKVRLVIDEYKDENGTYPILSAGSYLPHRSLSAWPSWQSALAKETGTSLPVDPVNEMGDCPGYNSITCWNEDTKTFSGSFSNLPGSSLVYTYETDAAGSSAALCTVFESGFPVYGAPVCILNVCLDFDGDGYGNPASPDCTNSGLDCNDTDPTVQTGSSEVCGNGADDDCDGLMDCADSIDCATDSACASAFCGNGVVDPGEDCDNGDTLPNDGCSPSCHWEVCGDGIRQTSEGCDDGDNGNNNDECIFDSTASYSCRSAFCGDGYIWNVNCGLHCEECDDGDTISGNGCSSTCELEECDDTDHDGYGVCPNCGTINGCTYDGNDCNDAFYAVCPASPAGCTSANSTCPVCIYPGATEYCDGRDNDCDDTDHSNGVNPGAIDDSLGIEDCYWLCQNPPLGNAAYDYNSTTRADAFRCCGNDAGEGNPFEFPETTCDDGLDNDCDGTCDLAFNDCGAGSVPDPDCSGCAGTFTNESLWYILGQDCNQCDYNGDQDGDQSPGNWNLYPGMADQCDSDCLQVAVTVHFDDFQVNETRCDGIDNDCDGDTDEGCDDDSDGYCDSSMELWYNNSACPNTVYTGDGIPGDDCDDDSANASQRYPGNAEVCGDGIDQDCDSTDLLCCTDNDGDLYIAESTVTSACGQVCGPANDQPCAGNNDCDDANPYMNGGLTETCDGYDNDCNMQVDEGCDNDGDQYCDELYYFYDNFTVSPFLGNHPCSNTTIGGVIGDDCDDDPLACGANCSPGHAEICDQYDNNCSDPHHYDGVNSADINESFTNETCDYNCEMINNFVWVGNAASTGDANLNCCGNDPGEGDPTAMPSTYEANETTCDDLLDNDCDGDANCADSDCAGDPACGVSCILPFTFPCTL